MFVKRKKPQKIRLRKSIKKDRAIYFGRLLLKIGILAMLFLGMIYLGNLLKSELNEKGFFNLKQIKINGAYYVQEQKILEIANIQQNTSILKINKKEIESKLLQITELENVKLIKYYPNKIVLNVKERTPVFQTKINDKFYYVDKNRVILDYPTDLKLIFIEQEFIENLDYFKILLEINQLFEKYFKNIFKRTEKITFDENFLIKLELKNDTIIKIICLDEFLALKKYGKHKVLQTITKKIKFLNIVEDDLNKREIKFKGINLEYFKNFEDFIIVEK